MIPIGTSGERSREGRFPEHFPQRTAYARAMARRFMPALGVLLRIDGPRLERELPGQHVFLRARLGNEPPRERRALAVSEPAPLPLQARELAGSLLLAPRIDVRGVRSP